MGEKEDRLKVNGGCHHCFICFMPMMTLREKIKWRNRWMHRRCLMKAQSIPITDPIWNMGVREILKEKMKQDKQDGIKSIMNEIKEGEMNGTEASI